MKKLLATDLDGTLLKDDKTISANTINKVHEMINEGHYFVVTTGRPFFRITKILEQLDIINDRFGVRIENVNDSNNASEQVQPTEAIQEEETTSENAEENFDYSDFEVEEDNEG